MAPDCNKKDANQCDVYPGTCCVERKFTNGEGETVYLSKSNCSPVEFFPFAL